LDRVEGKQHVTGRETGTTWEIDVKGVRAGDGATILVECRRHTTKRINQEAVGGLAYRIIDTGAAGGVIVSPLGLQEGARLVAAAKNISEVRLTPDSTPTEFCMRFLNQIFLGVSSTLLLTDSYSVDS
jgi:hypothetical protein